MSTRTRVVALEGDEPVVVDWYPPDGWAATGCVYTHDSAIEAMEDAEHLHGTELRWEYAGPHTFHGHPRPDQPRRPTTEIYDPADDPTPEDT